MPPFPDIDDREAKSVLEFLKAPMSRRGQDAESGPEPAAPGSADASDNGGQLYPKDLLKTMGSLYFLDPDGYPAVVPPWGTLNAIDLNTGRYLGRFLLENILSYQRRECMIRDRRTTADRSVTAGGVTFIGATVFDHKFHTFDAKTGKLLWNANVALFRQCNSSDILSERKAVCCNCCRRSITAQAPRAVHTSHLPCRSLTVVSPAPIMSIASLTIPAKVLESLMHFCAKRSRRSWARGGAQERQTESW